MFSKKQLSLGEWGELEAAKRYKKLGHKILHRNYFNKKGKRLGEIDFIALKDQNIIFVEVKTRSGEVSKFGTGVESVNYFKQQKLLRAVAFFLQTFPVYQKLQPQIDVCLIEVSGIDRQRKSVIIISNAVESRNG